MSENKNKNQEFLPAISVNSQYTKDFSLEIPFAPEIFLEAQSSPKMDIEVNVDANHMGENRFNVSLHINMNSDMNDKKLFILELVYGAVVTINVPEEHLEPVLLIEIPRLLFPFARSIITNALVDGGLPPFMLNPIDFVSLYQARKAEATKDEKVN